ncbi:hypothetical protein PQX77_021925 [Marasmius sp. AFHP31]|nr:hypothetical protein PQX77_021925 [Marasmius sp. AFHP31]
MSPVMSTLILTVKVFDGVCPTWRKWSKGLATYAMINKFYDHYTGHAVEPDQPQKPEKPVKLEQPQLTTRLEREATITVPVPATTMRVYEKRVEQWEKEVEQWEKDVKKWEKDVIRYEKEFRCWKKNKNKAMGSLRATTTIAVQTVVDEDDMNVS